MSHEDLVARALELARKAKETNLSRIGPKAIAVRVPEADAQKQPRVIFEEIVRRRVIIEAA